MSRILHRCAAVLCVALLACARPGDARGPAKVTGGPEVEVVGSTDDTPEGGDGAPRLALAFRYPDGTRIAIADEAISYVPFRDGVALVDTQRRLLLVTPDGARRVLAREAGAPPARSPAGELVYVARYDLSAEVHVLDTAGRDRIAASGLSNAGMLAPQPDGRVLFVGARNGGVAGVWIAERDGARCLSNCALSTGKPWGGDHVPLPSEPAALRVRGDRVEWDAADGTRRSALLSGASGAQDVPRVHQEGASRGSPTAEQEAVP